MNQMNIKQYLDATYLKTAAQAGVSENENLKIVKTCIQEAIDQEFKLIMIRPEMVTFAKEMITKTKSKVDIGTVIDFPLGNSNIDKKLIEAKKAIEDGANDLDFVCNYEAFKNGEIALVKNESIGKMAYEMGLHKWFIISKHAELKQTRTNLKKLG